jgi:P4 family phage/plasmid primase-like protien
MRECRAVPNVLKTLRRTWSAKRRRRRVTRAEAVTRKMEAAARLVERGVKLVVLHGAVPDGCTCRKGADCSRPGKHPATAGGANGATADLDVIRAALAARPRMNLAMATGKISGIVVLDIDRRNGGDVSLAALEAALGPLPETWTLRTGNGAHLCFAYPEGVDLPTRHGGELGDGLDLLSDGAYGITATSRHRNGTRYQWLRGRRPDDLHPARLPAAWLEHLRGPEKARPTAARLPTADAGRRVREGGRNTYLTRVGGHLRNSGLTGDGLAAALAQLNRQECDPPLPDEEIAEIAASLSRYVANTGDGDEAEALARAVLNEHFAGGERLLLGNDGRFWSFTGTHWQPLARPALEHLILRTQRLRPKSRLATTSLIKQAVTLLEAERSDNTDPLAFTAQQRPVINCRNGELWLDAAGGVTLRPHDARSYLRHCLDLDYDPAATCPRFDAALAEIFGRAAPAHGMVRHWWELIGYLIQPRRDIALILICEGGGSNGKTKLIETVQRLLGEGLVSAMRIQELGQDRFAMSDLLGKLMLVDDDVRAGIRLPDGELKQISEEKTITAQRKYGPSFTFTVRTVPVLLCNNPPSLADLSHGMQRRLMVVPFDRRFGDDEIDRELFPAIWAGELPGILNGALAGLGRLAARGYRFDRPAAVANAEARWLSFANPVPAFVADRCREGGSTPTGELYEAYMTWCAENGVTYKQQRLAFKRNLEHLGYASGRNNSARLTLGLTLR